VSRTLLLQQVLNGLAIGSVYAIFALGYTLIFSVLRIINFTHGAIFTIGAYATYALTGSQSASTGCWPARPCRSGSRSSWPCSAARSWRPCPA
jgi:branched-subunit amino acid ABC-type transport system permease component